MTMRVQFENENGIQAIINRENNESGCDFNARYCKCVNWLKPARAKLMDNEGNHDTINF